MNKFREYYLSEFKPNKENFGLRVAIARALLRVLEIFDKINAIYLIRLRLGNLVNRNYVYRKHMDVIKQYKPTPPPTNTDNIANDAPIFVFWLQGEENMPPMVKVCFKRLKRFAAQHPVILIDQKNMLNYATIPQGVVDKLALGDIKVQFFSDILRNKLLSENGGFWVDATVYLNGTPKAFVDYDKPFYSICASNKDNLSFWNKWFYGLGVKWTQWCMGGVRGNIFNTATAEVLIDYALKEKALINYLTVDYGAGLVYDFVPEAKKIVDQVIPDNPAWYYIYRKSDQKFDAQEWQKMTENTSIFKASFKLGLTEDPESLYQYLLKS